MTTNPTMKQVSNQALMHGADILIDQSYVDRCIGGDLSPNYPRTIKCMSEANAHKSISALVRLLARQAAFEFLQIQEAAHA